jgi:hypothetical protein
MVPETTALHCTVSPGWSWTLAGVIATVVGGTPILTISPAEAMDPGSGFVTVTWTVASFCEAMVLPVAVA